MISTWRMVVSVMDRCWVVHRGCTEFWVQDGVVVRRGRGWLVIRRSLGSRISYMIWIGRSWVQLMRRRWSVIWRRLWIQKVWKRFIVWIGC